jgi:hypothetical protein
MVEAQQEQLRAGHLHGDKIVRNRAAASSNQSYHTCISRQDSKHNIFYTKIQVDSSATKEVHLDANELLNSSSQLLSKSWQWALGARSLTLPAYIEHFRTDHTNENKYFLQSKITFGDFVLT